MQNILGKQKEKIQGRNKAKNYENCFSLLIVKYMTTH